MEVQDGPTEAPVLTAQAVTSGYRDLIAVRDVSMEVCSGEVVALFGPNGAGKSTLLLSAMGVLPLTSGEFGWCGKALSGPTHVRARNGLAFVPEQRTVVNGLSVRANLELGRGGIHRALEIFPELQSLLDRSAGLLSGGEQQMLVLARQLATGPVCLLVDELSLGLAPQAVDRLFEVIRECAQRAGTGVLLVEQQVRRALDFVDRWYLLKDGAVQEHGRPDQTELLERAYLGCPDQRW